MAVKKGTTSTTQRLPSGIHQVASRAKDITPVPTKTQRFEKAKTTLAPFIKQEDRGDDQIEVVDVTAALQRAREVDVTAAIKTLKDLGVSSAKIKEAQKAVVEIVDDSAAPIGSLAVPTPTVIRPRESTSSVDSTLAVTTGLRWGTTITLVTSLMELV